MFYIVHKTTNIINGKYYIGVHSTTNLNDGYLGSGIHLNRSIKKYGKEHFIREVLMFCSSEEEMYLEESKIVTKKFISQSDNYNQKVGGYGGWGGYVRTEYHKTLASLNSPKARPNLQGNNNPAKRPEVRAKISAAKLAENAAKRPEVRAKMSKAKKGRTSNNKGKVYELCSCVICGNEIKNIGLTMHYRYNH